MTKMKAVVLRQSESPEADNYFEDVETAVPKLERPTDLLIEVRGVSVNPVDVKTSMKKTNRQTDTFQIIGWDGTGIVRKIGKEVDSFSVGDEVFYSGDYTRSGSNSQYQLVDERLVAKKPVKLSVAETAAIPLTALTAWESLFDRLGITEADRGKQILIINGAGGVGSMAIQLAKLAGLEVVTTASREETIDWVKKMGADQVINHRQSLTEGLNRLGIKELPFILCLYDTDNYWEEMAKIIQAQGKICSIVETERPVDLGLLKSKSVTFSWEFMFTRSMYQTEDQGGQQEILQKVGDLYNRGQLQTTVTQELRPINAKNIKAAHKMLSKGKMIGKVVLTGWDK